MKCKNFVYPFLYLSSVTAHADITSNLVAYYPFNGNANDESGNNQHGIVYGAALLADRFGTLNSAYSFNGVSDYIDVGQMNFTLPITVSLWFKSAQINAEWKTIFGWNFIYSPFQGIQIRSAGGGKIGVRIGSYTSDILINGIFDGDNRWHHIAIMRDNNNNVITYVDGSINASSHTTDNLGSSYNLYFGKSFRASMYQEEFKGAIDDVRVYNRTLSAADVDELYQEQPSPLLKIVKQGAGSGTISSTPAGIDCGADCVEYYPVNTVVTLTVRPNAGSVWGGFTGHPDCTDRIVTMEIAKTCTGIFNIIPVPTVVTNAASDITTSSVTLNGSVISTGATATSSFNFGLTANYGSIIAAAPSQIYSSTAVAITGTNTGLTCGTSYYFRAKAVNSSGTGYGANQIFTTADCVINSWLYPFNAKFSRNQEITLKVFAKSNSVKIGNYNFNIAFDPTKLLLETGYCNQGVCPGTNSLNSNIVYTNTTAGTINVIGQGGETIVGNDLELLVIHFRTKLTPGPTQVSLITNVLATLNQESIGLEAKGLETVH